MVRRVLWPGCRHAPQSLVRLAGGSSASVVVVVVVERGVAEGEGAGGGVGDGEREGAGSSSDAIGRGACHILKLALLLPSTSPELLGKVTSQWSYLGDGAQLV